MPKSHAVGGPTYAGHVDVTPDGVEPQWVPVAEVAQPDPEPAPKVEPTPRKRHRKD